MKKKMLCGFAVLCAAVMGLAGCSGDALKGKSMNETFYNPLRIEKGMGDPWMYFHDGYYYYMHSEGTVVRVTKSEFMTQVVPDANDESVTKIIFRQKEINVVQIWAPEIFFFDGCWYVYFTATVDAADPNDSPEEQTMKMDSARRIYGMKSKTADAMGEWETAVKIDLPMNYRAIDATFMNYRNKQYMVWSGWPLETTSTYRQHLYITEMETGNPLKAKSLDDEMRVQISEPTYDWEIKDAPQNEGPAVAYAPDGTPFVLYSGSFSKGDQYCIAYVGLTGGTDPMKTESWEKCTEPLMRTDESEVIAPGHNSVIPSPDGTETWICYHAAKYGGAGWNRMMRLQKMEWRGNKPYVGGTSAFNAELPLPSGEKVNRVKYEAEKAKITDGRVVSPENDGYASGDKFVKFEEGGSVEFSVDVPQSGKYLLFIRYSNVEVEDEKTFKKMKVGVNNDSYELYAPFTEYDDLYSLTYSYVTLYERAGEKNVIKIEGDKAFGIDCIIVDYLDR